MLAGLEGEEASTCPARPQEEEEEILCVGGAGGGGHTEERGYQSPCIGLLGPPLPSNVWCGCAHSEHCCGCTRHIEHREAVSACGS